MNALGDLHAGRTIVVAGGTGNVGRTLVGSFLGAGATVVVPSRSAGKLKELRAAHGEAAARRLIPIEGDIADEEAAPELVDEIVSQHGPLHGAVASLGRFVPAPPLLSVPVRGLEQVIDDYLIAHVVAARALIPAIEDGGSYTLINGPLAFRPMSRGAALVSIATAAQAMFARALMDQVDSVRVNEVVLYTGFGWGDGEKKMSPVEQQDVARYVCYLASGRGGEVRGRTIHLDSLSPLKELAEGR